MDKAIARPVTAIAPLKTTTTATLAADTAQPTEARISTNPFTAKAMSRATGRDTVPADGSAGNPPFSSLLKAEKSRLERPALCFFWIAPEVPKLADRFLVQMRLNGPRFRECGKRWNSTNTVIPKRLLLAR